MGYFPSYVIEAMSTAADVVVLYNDWPVYRGNEPDDVFTVSMRVNAMTLESTNVLQVLARPRDPHVPMPVRAMIDVRLFRMLSPDELVHAFRQEWRAHLRPLNGAEEYVEIARHELEFARTFGRWTWEDGMPYMPEQRAEILDVIERIWTALSRRDVATYIDFCSVKIEE
jgi:hypothetical protein